MKILVVATQLPPFNGSSNIRILNYINQLSNRGHDIDVLTVEYPKDSIAYDSNLENVFRNDINLYRVAPGVLYKLFYQRKSSSNGYISNSKKSFKNKIKKTLGKIIKSYFLIPDSFVQWIYPAYKKGKDLMNKSKYDLILSIHETPSSHLVALKLKKEFADIKWTAYWSDPWNGDPVHRLKQPRVKKIIEERLEKEVVRNVDRFLFTTQKTIDYYSEKYTIPKEKFDIVYRGYDYASYKEISNNSYPPKKFNEDKINIVHVGTIYKSLRDVRPLYDAIKKMELQNKEANDKFNFIFVGQFDSEDDEKLLKSLKSVEVIPFVPYKEALNYIVQADVLLLYGNKESTQVPGKAYEYLGSKASIFTILGDNLDELKHLMVKANKGPIIINDAGLIYDELLSFYQLFTHNSIPKEWTQIQEDFRWEKVGEDLENKLFI
ncbi:glycosyltransferase [Priestia megaterium]|uniref:glycosyltransferase n=1 Tax=Priestia megaterium TaxID=1404 RepID=UPI002E1DF109|nr:glycosyltransferase [Priestia megaterium]